MDQACIGGYMTLSVYRVCFPLPLALFASSGLGPFGQTKAIASPSQLMPAETHHRGGGCTPWAQWAYDIMCSCLPRLVHLRTPTWRCTRAWDG